MNVSTDLLYILLFGQGEVYNIPPNFSHRRCHKEGLPVRTHKMASNSSRHLQGFFNYQ